MGLIAIWKWFLGIVKKFINWLCPKWFKPKAEKSETN
jgi:hypothetical protein